MSLTEQIIHRSDRMIMTTGASKFHIGKTPKNVYDSLLPA